MPKRKTRRNLYTKASPVKITRADGTVEEAKPLAPGRLNSVIGKGNRRWAEGQLASLPEKAERRGVGRYRYNPVTQKWEPPTD